MVLPYRCVSGRWVSPEAAKNCLHGPELRRRVEPTFEYKSRVSSRSDHCVLP